MASTWRAARGEPGFTCFAARPTSHSSGSCCAAPPSPVRTALAVRGAPTGLSPADTAIDDLRKSVFGGSTKETDLRSKHQRCTCVRASLMFLIRDPVLFERRAHPQTWHIQGNRQTDGQETGIVGGFGREISMIGPCGLLALRSDLKLQVDRNANRQGRAGVPSPSSGYAGARSGTSAQAWRGAGAPCTGAHPMVEASELACERRQSSECFLMPAIALHAPCVEQSRAR